MNNCVARKGTAASEVPEAVLCSCIANFEVLLILTSLRNQPYYRILACGAPSSQLGLLYPSQAGRQIWSQ
jgi:hypothetical protein